MTTLSNYGLDPHLDWLERRLLGIPMYERSILIDQYRSIHSVFQTDITSMNLKHYRMDFCKSTGKPEEMIQYRSKTDGGLGLTNIYLKSLSLLTRSFFRNSDKS